MAIKNDAESYGLESIKVFYRSILKIFIDFICCFHAMKKYFCDHAVKVPFLRHGLFFWLDTYFVDDYKSHMVFSTKKTGISLFSSGGIGDLALRAVGVDMLLANEILKDRASLFIKNFPDCEMIVGDIREHKKSIISTAEKALKGRVLDVLFATPPCQGMSKNGRGKLLNLIRNGDRPALDERNRLIIDVLDVANALKPRMIIFENVPEMENTLIQTEVGDLVEIIDYIRQRLGSDYVGDCHVCEFADYGVPQRRQRLITVFTRCEAAKKLFLCHGKAWLPKPTHAKNPDVLQKKWISVDDAINHLEPIDAKSKVTSQGFNAFHKVPILDENKYFWVAHTPEGASAFDNQCANPQCLFKG